MHAGGNGNQEEREQQRAASYREREEGWRRRRGEGRGAHSGDEKPQAGGGDVYCRPAVQTVRPAPAKQEGADH